MKDLAAIKDCIVVHPDQIDFLKDKMSKNSFAFIEDVYMERNRGLVFKNGEHVANILFENGRECNPLLTSINPET